MQNVIDKIELMFAALGAFLGWFFGGFDGFLYALIIFVVMDYFTGILAAGVKHELSSENAAVIGLPIRDKLKGILVLLADEKKPPDDDEINE